MVGMKSLSRALTILLSVGVYSIWTVVLDQNNTIGILLGTITAALTAGALNRSKS